MKLAALLLLMATPVAAERQCGPREGVVEALLKQYGETRQSVALTSGGALMEMFASSATGTWTALVTAPNGISCIVSAGTSFERVAPTPVGEEM